jgi:hypothetical protein
MPRTAWLTATFSYCQLYDQPQEDKRRLRVVGPFTVETLQNYEPISPQELARQRTEDKELGNFEDLIFAHLKSAGVKTGIKEENAVFVRIDRLAHTALHAEGWFNASSRRRESAQTSASQRGLRTRAKTNSGFPVDGSYSSTRGEWRVSGA